MAKAKTHAFLDSVFGVLGKRDQTVGKTPALGLTMAKGLKHTILGIKTKKTAKASPLQLERQALWNAADCAYKDMCPGHQTLLEQQWKTYNATHEVKFLTLYQYHMHLLLTVRKTTCEGWTEGFNGFYYDRGSVISWTDGFNGPNWNVEWKTEWFEGFNS